MILTRAFIAGLTFPAVFVPVALLIAACIGNDQLMTILSAHILPLAWGFWNVLYFAFCKDRLPANKSYRLFLTGAGLGFVAALYGVFVIDFPPVVGIPQSWYYAPLVGVPLIYGLLWRFVVDPINALLGLHDR